MKSIQGVSTPTNDTTIWRYMSFSRFEQLLNSGKLYLARIDQFSDFNEGAMTKATKNRHDEELRTQGASDLSGLLPWFHLFLNRKYWYASCWNCNDIESNLLWRSYGTPKIDDKFQFKVAIRSTVGKLLEAVNREDIYLGKVNYLDFESDDPFVGQDSIQSGALVYIKQKEYQDEKEIRLGFENNSSMVGGILANLPETPKGITIDIELDKLIDEIYIEATPVDWERLGRNNNGQVDLPYRESLDEMFQGRVNMVEDLFRQHKVTNAKIRISSIL